jgi:hypothetical protein
MSIPPEEYDSGPFCRHFSDPADCTLNCKECDHRCVDHPFDGGECLYSDECGCSHYVDPEETS